MHKILIIKLIYVLSLSCPLQLMSQEIYSYERDFTNKDDYNFEEIIFYNTIEKINLFGTLVTPKIDYNKIVIIVPGTGKDTRHSHFILAEELVKSGIAVFRFDERGVGKSEGVFSPFSSHLSQDTYFSYLKLRDDKRFEHKEIGIIGHSLGGIAAVNTYEKIPDLDFLVLIGTPVKKNGDFFKFQALNNIDEFYRIKGHSQQEVANLIDKLNLVIVNHNSIKEIRNEGKIVAKSLGFKNGYHKFLTPSHIDIVKEDNEQTYMNLKVPTLYLIGTKDRFVDNQSEVTLLKSFENKNIEINIYPELNHWLTEKGLPVGSSLYLMDKKAMLDIIEWIKKL